jgi:FkbM family methyltransferase
MLNQFSRAARSVVHRALRVPGVGAAFCGLTSRVGLKFLTRWAARHTTYNPPAITFDVADADGLTSRGTMLSSGGRDQIVRSIWLNGLDSYEAPLPKLFMRLVQGADAIFDVGANSGLYAILAALTDKRCRIFSFEPFPDVLNSLRANIAANQLTERVTVVAAALGDTPGETNLFIPEKAYGDALETSASLVKEFRKSHSEVLKVQVLKIDDFVVQNNITNVSLIRAEVEGAEHLVMQGATNVLQQHRPYVFVEVLADISATYLERSRAKAGYRAMYIGENTLTPEKEVKCMPRSPNHLWYPPERHTALMQAAAECGIQVIGDA